MVGRQVSTAVSSKTNGCVLPAGFDGNSSRRKEVDQKQKFTNKSNI